MTKNGRKWKGKERKMFDQLTEKKTIPRAKSPFGVSCKRYYKRIDNDNMKRIFYRCPRRNKMLVILIQLTETLRRPLFPKSQTKHICICRVLSLLWNLSRNVRTHFMQTNYQRDSRFPCANTGNIDNGTTKSYDASLRFWPSSLENWNKQSRSNCDRGTDMLA